MEKKFEELFVGFVNEEEQGRVGRLARNMEILECSNMQEAIQIDNVQTQLVQGVFRLVGFSVDQIADLPTKGLQGNACTQFLGGLGANILAAHKFVSQVAMMTAIQGNAFVVNPRKPNCSCENCRLAKALSIIMLREGD